MKDPIRFNYIITNGQIGNFIAFDSFLTDQEKKNIKKIIIFPFPNNHNLDFKDEKGNYQLISLLENNNCYNKNLKIEFIDKKNVLKKEVAGQ